MKKLMLLALALSAGLKASSQNYVPISLTGFNADVVANGTGPAIASTTHDVDGVDYNLVSLDFTNPANQSPTNALPNNGTINSAVAATPGLTFQLAPYTGNNSLRISGTGSGTLSFATPRAADQVYVLGFSGSNTSATTITVTFSDATTQVFTQTFADWFYASGYAIQGISRVLRTTDAIENSATDPRLYQYLLPISAANTGKTIQSITFNKTSAGTGVLNVMGVTVRTVPSTTPNDVGVSAIMNPASGCVLSAQETITVTVANMGSAAQSNIPVSYTLNNGTPVSEVMAGPLAPNSSVNYSFTTKANLSTAGAHTIEARTSLTGDALATNDAHTKTINLSAIPASPTVSPTGPGNICVGSTFTLTATPAATGATLQWYKDGVAIANATGVSYDATTSGSYTVSSVQNGCASSPSTAVVLTANPIPAAPTLTAGGPTTFCNGNSVAISATTTVTGATFEWFKDGTPIAGVTGATYTAMSAGEYTAVASANGCSSMPSFAVLVTVNGPAKPSISRSGFTLTSSSTSGNQWYKDGNQIAGANGRSYVVTSSGAYTVKASANNCTSPASDPVAITLTGVADEAVHQVSVYPNPSTGAFSVAMPQAGVYQVSVYDLSGRIVFEQSVREKEFGLHLNQPAKGIYLLKIAGEKETIIKKLVIE